MASFFCNADGPSEPLEHYWENVVGGGHASLALRADWQQQLLRVRQELGFRHLRVRGILDDVLGTLVSRRSELVRSFFNSDRIVDFVLGAGMRPFVELGFMPSALASGERTAFSHRANVTPPADSDEWRRLMDALVRHWIDRHGREEVRQWYFEVWHHPNRQAFWTGTKEDYFTFYRITAETLKAIDAGLRVGGPATAEGEWLVEFREYCERNRVPCDFISTQPPMSASGAQLRQETERLREEARGLPLYYCEWSAPGQARDPLRDEPYGAAFVLSALLALHGLVAGCALRSFTDLGDEDHPPSVPYHGGAGLLNLYGIAKPAYHAYALLHRAGERILPVEGRHDTVQAWVTDGSGGLMVLLVNSAPPGLPIATEPVDFTLRLPAAALSATVERIDPYHANPKRLWRQIGRPEYLQATEVEQLGQAAALAAEALALRREGDLAAFDLALPPHGVAAVTLQLERG